MNSTSFATTNEAGVFEKIYFLPKTDYVLEFAFSAPITETTEFEAEMTTILNSIQWKR